MANELITRRVAVQMAVRDGLWPTLDPLPEGYLTRIDALANDVPELGDMADDVFDRWEAEVNTDHSHEQERRARIDGKLMAMIGLASVALTITGALTTFLATGKFGDFRGWSLAIVFLAALYVVLQVLRAFKAGVEGLRVRDYDAITASRPTAGETAMQYRYRRSVEQHRANVRNGEHNNDKMSQWKLCIRSLKNLGAGMAAAFLMLTAIALYRSFL